MGSGTPEPCVARAHQPRKFHDGELQHDKLFLGLITSCALTIQIVEPFLRIRLDNGNSIVT
jgi:hypothetical protein